MIKGKTSHAKKCDIFAQFLRFLDVYTFTPKTVDYKLTYFTKNLTHTTMLFKLVVIRNIQSKTDHFIWPNVLF